MRHEPRRCALSVVQFAVSPIYWFSSWVAHSLAYSSRSSQLTASSSEAQLKLEVELLKRLLYS